MFLQERLTKWKGNREQPPDSQGVRQEEREPENTKSQGRASPLRRRRV